jgi:hypothetical protein
MQDNRKILSQKELIDILNNPPQEFIKGDKKTTQLILIEDYTIEKDLEINLKTTLNFKLKFKNCIFKTSLIFSFISNQILILDGCEMSDVIFGGVLTKGIILKLCKVETIYLNTPSEEIRISDCNIKELNTNKVSDNLNIADTNIKKISIDNDEDKSGKIFIKDCCFDGISLKGTNKGREIRFENIKCNDIFICNFKNEGSLKFFGLEPKSENNDRPYFEIFNSNLEKVEFYRTSFSKYKELIIIDSFITDTLFIGCEWGNNVRALQTKSQKLECIPKDERKKINTEESIAIKEAYRQLKVSMSKISDKIQEHKFYSEELNYYNKSLPWGCICKNQFWDKLILFGSKYFSDYGQSFFKPLIWLLVGHFVFFIIAICFNGFATLHLSISEPTCRGFEEAFEKFFIYINPLRKVDTSFSGYLIIIDLLMRIWSSYMIYNLIRASRRFIS